MSKTDWLQSLKTDSKVIVVSGRSFSRYRELRTVDKTTATQVVVRGRRYRKENGRLCGDGYGGHLEEPTSEVLREMDEERRTDRARATIRELTEYHRWSGLGLPALEKLAKALTGIVPAKEASDRE